MRPCHHSARHLLLCLCLCLCLMRPVTTTRAQIAPAPALLHFQGRLTRPDGTPLPDGNYALRFSLWSAATGGTERWNQSVNPVAVRNGTFAVVLNVGTPADLFHTDLWLEIRIGSDPPLRPRQRLVSVAYALKANRVADDAITSASILDGTITGADIAGGTITVDKLATGAQAWWLTGNAGTNPATHFVGTT
ncbi:MAG: hypothetical protein RMJ43_07370, partial [Chloroherpetonaceae bacterium]|nr:hypothetical protein [Chthonomonadaceae bacterium]MDW8207641.1 hypothetical protein [Chloroherpetonaceae bacterium]